MTEKNKKKLKIDDLKDDGEFLIEIDDYIENFECTIICMFQEKYKFNRIPCYHDTGD